MMPPDNLDANGEFELPGANRLHDGRAWCILAIWGGLIAAVLGLQEVAAYMFGHGYWSPRYTSTIEWVQWHLPFAAILVISVAFLFGLRWLVPAKRVRNFARICGIILALLGLIVSAGISMIHPIVVELD